MDIKYLGHSSFILKGSKGTVVTDPFNTKTFGGKFPKISADVVTISHQHDDHNASDAIDGTPLVITMPGEYEKSGIRVYGFETYHDKKNGQERGKNTIYKLEVDDVSVLHCGDLGHILNNDILEEIDGVDVLLIPVGGFYTIGAEEAIEVISKIEPSYVIPMHYQSDSFNKEIMDKLAPVSGFITKIGVAHMEPVDKLTIKKQDVGEDMKVVVMKVA